MSEYLIPNDEERRRLFYWIKKAGSYTLWERAGRFYKAWNDVFQAAYKDCAQHPAPKHGQLIPDDQSVFLNKGYACFEEALARLKRGDKSPFKWLGAKGHISESWRPLGYWTEAPEQVATRGAVLPLLDSDYWPPIWNRLQALIRAAAQGYPVREEEHTDLPAPLAYLPEESGADFLIEECAFPPGDLPPVPVPDRVVLVKTGDPVPCFGIYEPVKVEMKSAFLGLGKRPMAPADGKFELAGAMNYLHQGSPAPTMATPDGPPGRQGTTPTVWRLLWEDTRYRDGVIPEEEKDYLFFEYVPPEPETTPISEADLELLTRKSGEAAPKAGVWAAQNYLDLRVELQQGEVLPHREDQSIVWVYVPNR